MTRLFRTTLSASRIYCAIPTLALLLLNCLQEVEKPSSDEAQKESNKPDAVQPKVIIDGPLHESFADVERSSHRPNPLIEKKPPEPIDEIQPTEKPKGKNVNWIGGYWYWDRMKDDFSWVSGVWRASPPGQNWTAGYWDTTQEGSRWISGFWRSKDAPTHEFLPAPPASLETGPRKRKPTDLHFYCPGNWEYNRETTEYVWRAGRWHPYQMNWRWIPVDYIWTPNGHGVSNGYWDYKLQDRGDAYLAVSFINLDERLDEQLRQNQRGQLQRIKFRPTQRADLSSAPERRREFDFLREEQRDRIQDNRNQFVRDRERQRRQEELNSNITREQRQQIQMARQQRAEVSRAREVRRQSSQSPNPPSTEQLRLQNQRESIQRNRERFMRNQQRIKRQADQSGGRRN